MEKRILLVDDDASFREVMRFNLEDEGFTVFSAENGEEGLLKFQQLGIDLIVTDLKMPRMDGLEFMKRVKEGRPEVLFIVITAFGDVESAVGSMKAGAFDFIPKPCDRDHFKHVVKKAWDHISLKSEVRRLNRSIQGFDKELLFVSKEMRRVDELIQRVCKSDATVLVSGESGTGKELVAREIHKRGKRSDGPFVVINCAAIPRELMESELFGHRKGAFTGAVSERKGKFEMADGGTLFLDEIGELPIELQPRLLRALQEKSIDPVGGGDPVPVDVRVIAATNRDLPEDVREGNFREDLYFRINVFPIKIPPLRERREDILHLAEFFLRKYGLGKGYRLSEGAEKQFVKYEWKGNVRELENICQRLVLLSDGDEISENLVAESGLERSCSILDPKRMILPPDGLDLVDFEKRIIEEALRMNDFNRTKTASYLCIPRHVLLYRIEKYEIEGR